MNKLLVAVEQHSYTTLTKASVREYLTKEWLPAVKATIRPSTYNCYVQHVECHIVPHIGSVKLVKLTGSQVNARYAKLAESGRKDGKKGLSPMTIHLVHACLHKACEDAVRGVAPQESPRCRRPATQEGRRHEGDADLDQGAAQGVPQGVPQGDEG